MDLKQYKNTYIKLLNPTTFSEIFGLLVDFDTKNNICLHKAIITANRMMVDPSSVMNNIIQFKYDNAEGSVINSILCPAYNNDTNGRSRQVSWINISGWVLTPIHTNDTEPKGDALEYRDVIEGWIENVYENYDKMRELLPTVNNSQDNNEKEE